MHRSLSGRTVAERRSGPVSASKTRRPLHASPSDRPVASEALGAHSGPRHRCSRSNRRDPQGLPNRCETKSYLDPVVRLILRNCDIV